MRQTMLTCQFLKTPDKTCDTVIFLTDTQKTLGPAARETDKVCAGFLSHVLAAHEKFTGKLGETAILPLPPKSPYKQVVFLGLGDLKALDSIQAATAGGTEPAA